MARSRFLVVVAATFAVGGCASVRQTTSGWFGEAQPTPAAVESHPQTYYAGATGLTVYAEASGSSKVVGRLAPHEQVGRTRLERGYAYIMSRTGLTGWVDNAQLLWRLPPAGEVSTPSANAPAKAEKETPAAPAPAVAIETPQAESAPPTLTPTSIPVTPTVARKPAPGLFDPY